MNLWNETKSIPISRSMVWEAYKKVKANKGSAGVDEIDMVEYDANRSKHLYKLWNRMASGSYFPPPVKRWLETLVLTKSGELIKKEGKGTPQGGVISPLLANLFLHYAFDKWLESTDSTVSFARYADDAILHCKSKQHAEQILKLVQERMGECGLELHPVKTKIVYCRDYRRQGKHKEVKFDFLSFSFQPRTTKSKKTGNLFLGYDCAISISSRKRLADELGELKIEQMTFKSVVGIAQRLNPIIRGWINYYGKYRGYELSKVFRLLRIRIVRWARKRYKRYRTSLTKACKWLDRVRVQYPNLFYHWQVGYSN